MTDWEGREKGASRTDSGGTASPKTDGLCQSEGGAPSLRLTICLGPRDTKTSIHSQTSGLSPNEVRQWLDRAIVALGAERDALANCRLHGELTHVGFEERVASDEAELAAALSTMLRHSRGWRKRAIQGAYYAVAQDREARRLIRSAARLLDPAESNASSPNEVSTSALPPDEPTILNSSIPKSAGKESAP